MKKSAIIGMMKCDRVRYVRRNQLNLQERVTTMNCLHDFPAGRAFLAGIAVSASLITGPMLNAHAAQTVSGDKISVTVDQGRYAIRSRGEAMPFATGELRYQGVVRVVPVKDDAFGEGQEITVTAADGSSESFRVFSGLPFVLYRSVLVNTATAAKVLNKVPLMNAALDLRRPARATGGSGHRRTQTPHEERGQLRVDGGGRSCLTRGRDWWLADP